MKVLINRLLRISNRCIRSSSAWRVRDSQPGVHRVHLSKIGRAFRTYHEIETRTVRYHSKETQKVGKETRLV